MRHLLSYLLLTAGAMFVACTETDVRTDGTDGYDVPIFFSAGAESKSAVTGDSELNTAGNRLTVYDVHTLGGESSLYIDGLDYTCSAGGWSSSPVKYWTKSGTHYFAVYNSYSQADGVSAPEVNFVRETRSMMISDWAIDGTNQFDFMYAYATRSMDEPNPYRPVALQMKHILCAVQFNVINLILGSDVTFNSFSLSGLHNTGSAEITPDGITTAVGPGTSDFSTGDENVPLGYNVPFSVFSGRQTFGQDGTILIWPHSADRFGNLSASLSYTVEGDYFPTVRTIDISALETNNWRSGYRYIYNIYIKDNRISFEVKVVDWIYDDIILDE